MALLHVLQSWRKDWPELKVTAAHVNHCLRGAEADRDEEHVRRYCQREGIPLEVLKIDVREEAAKRKLGLEACGRAVRYEFFRRLAGENGVIATAHTLSDLAETVLLHLTRGTGLKGLCGIPPVRENIVRPLIDCSRRKSRITAGSIKSLMSPTAPIWKPGIPGIRCAFRCFRP